MQTSLLFLIGYRGCGKSTVAQELAARLQCECIDSDRLIEGEAGESIAEIFAHRGEAAFRDLESGAVRSICQRAHAIVALGGGAVVREENRALIAAAGPVVWLVAGTDTLLARTAADPATASSRPRLTSSGGRAEVERLLAERSPIYRGLATCQVDTDGKSPAEIADEILHTLSTLAIPLPGPPC